MIKVVICAPEDQTLEGANTETEKFICEEDGRMVEYTIMPGAMTQEIIDGLKDLKKIEN